MTLKFGNTGRRVREPGLGDELRVMRRGIEKIAREHGLELPSLGDGASSTRP